MPAGNASWGLGKVEREKVAAIWRFNAASIVHSYNYNTWAYYEDHFSRSVNYRNDSLGPAIIARMQRLSTKSELSKLDQVHAILQHYSLKTKRHRLFLPNSDGKHELTASSDSVFFAYFQS